MEEQIYVFNDGIFVSVENVDSNPKVADSFLVTDGRVRSLDRHIERFETSANKLTRQDLRHFWNQVIRLIPREGQWFPRIELTTDDQLIARIRTGLDYEHRVKLWSAEAGDDRVDPTTKGPDLAFGASLRRKANLHGADEAVILDSAGYVIEGALSSLVWWKDDVLYGPNHETKWLPSVTRLDVFEIAAQAGFETATAHVKPEDLIGLEIWVLSSFTGIRPVVDWLNLDGEVGEQQHLESFQRRMKLMSRDLDSFLR
ncbi:MAG: hypothetical protein RLZ53_568 [Actinomycetota bacterium]